MPGRDPWELPATSRGGLEGLGFEILERPEPSFLFDGSVLITGEVARTTDFERGFPIHQALRGGSWEPDPLILDDQALVVHVAGRGLLVLTGCGHAGVVNILEYARTTVRPAPVRAVVGGLHLFPADEASLDWTAGRLKAMGVGHLLGAHCTGVEAVYTLRTKLGLDRRTCVVGAVGSGFDLEAGIRPGTIAR